MTKSKKGFTIIEVVLVLAIAGLIFLMVFIALPALQRSQRNTRRRSDMARILSAFTEYQSNNGGRMPGTGTNHTNEMNTFVNKYVNGQGTQNATGATTCVGDQFCDPDGTPYSFKSVDPTVVTADINDALGTAPTFDHFIYYYNTAKCGEDEGDIAKGSGKADIAILYVLEGGAIYCGDNQ